MRGCPKLLDASIHRCFGDLRSYGSLSQDTRARDPYLRDIAASICTSFASLLLTRLENIRLGYESLAESPGTDYYHQYIRH